MTRLQRRCLRPGPFICVVLMQGGQCFAQAEPAWPESRSECEDWSDRPTAAARALMEAELSERYLLRVKPVAGFYAGGGLGGESVDYGWRAGAGAELGVMSPVWLSGSVSYASTSSQGLLHADLLSGFSIVRWRTRWVDAGVAQAGGVATAWNSHCQHRRNEFALLVGGKMIVARETLTAAQVGIGESFSTNGGFGDWSVAGLYDPVHPSYGAQLKLGSAGGFLPYPVYLGTVMGGMLGERKSWWGTIDVGVTFEL